MGGAESRILWFWEVLEDSSCPLLLHCVYQPPSNLSFYLYPWLTIGLCAINTRPSPQFVVYVTAFLQNSSISRYPISCILARCSAVGTNFLCLFLGFFFSFYFCASDTVAAPTVFEAKLVFMWLVMGAGTGGDKQQAGCSGTIPQYRTTAE